MCIALTASCESIFPDFNSWFKKAYRWSYKQYLLEY